MEEFEDSQLRDLQEVDGIVLRDVHGERVAIGKGFPYENIFKPRDYKASVVVDKLADLPKEYITYIEDVKADKKKLYEDLKAGTEINGAHLKANRGTTIK